MIIEIIGTLICIWIIIVFTRLFYEFFNFKNYPRKKQKEIAEKSIKSILPLAITITILHYNTYNYFKKND